MEYVSKDRIIICKIIMFESYDAYEGLLYEKELTYQEQYRLCIFKDEIIDFITGDILEHMDTAKDGTIISPIKQNTMYIDRIYNCNNVSEEEYEYAQELYLNYIEKKKLIKEKKLIPFQQKIIYDGK